MRALLLRFHIYFISCTTHRTRKLPTQHSIMYNTVRLSLTYITTRVPGPINGYLRPRTLSFRISSSGPAREARGRGERGIQGRSQISRTSVGGMGFVNISTGWQAWGQLRGFRSNRWGWISETTP